MKRLPRYFVTGVFSLWVIVSPWWPASAFALRGDRAGGEGPRHRLSGINVEGGKALLVRRPEGSRRRLLGDLETRSPRSCSSRKGARRYESSGLNVIAVNADHQEMKAEDFAAVREKVKEAGPDLSRAP